MAKKRKSKSRESKQMRRAPRAATPKTYPSPAERERIIARRDKLLQELIPLLIETSSGKLPDKGIAKLTRKYEQAEVLLVLDRFQQSAASEAILDAFSQDKVDPKIMQPYDVDFLYER